LILRDVVKWCEKNGILTGVGRGSAGGALVSWLLGIIKLNPLQFDLLFERFLNKGIKSQKKSFSR
jgi:DNA polymerase-3 subunit alpha